MSKKNEALYGITANCFQDHTKPTTPEQLNDPYFGQFELNLHINDEIKMGIMITCYRCRPKQTKEKNVRRRKKD